MRPTDDASGRYRCAAQDAPPAGVRPLVADSWRRSWALGVDPEADGARLVMGEQQLQQYRSQHPLAAMMPLIRRLLTDTADEAGHIVAVGDSLGRLLWVEGHHRLRARAEQMWFVEGALWSERGAGTNAPGTALALDRPVAIGAREHFGLQVRSWSCVAAPVHDPLTGRLLGVIDLTGGPDVAGARTLALVQACAVAVEAGLSLRAAGLPSWDGGSSGVGATDQAVASLTLSGPEAGLFQRGQESVQLSPRHTEMVWLLSMAPQGLSAQQLDAALHSDGSHLVTVRAEMTRLRKMIGADLLGSRPYRLIRPVRTEVDLVREHLTQGRLLDALDAFRGVPLPQSQAPGVQECSDEFVAEVRQAVLESGSATVLQRWTDLPVGRADADAWQRLEAVLVDGSPRRPLARIHRLRLEAEQSRR